MRTPRLLTQSDVDVDHSSIECVDLLPSPLTWGRAKYNCFSLPLRDSGTVCYNPASGEVLGCTVLKLASFHLSVPRTTVCHQLTVHGQSRMNWLRWQQVICTRWITAAQEQSIGEFRICSQLWATVPVQHARTVFCQQRMMKSSSLLVEIYQRNSGEGRARCWCQ